jgi:hypothetical protein
MGYTHMMATSIPRGVQLAVPVTPAVTQLCQADDKRVLLIITSDGGGNGMTIWIDNPSIQVNAGQVGTNTSPMILTLKEHGKIVQSAWYATAPVNPCVVTVFTAQATCGCED